MRTTRGIRTAAVVLAGGLVLAACGDDAAVTEASPPTGATETEEPGGDETTAPDPEVPETSKPAETVEEPETSEPPETTEPSREPEQDADLAADLEVLITGELPEIDLLSQASLPPECPGEAMGCYIPGDPATLVMTMDMESFVYTELLAHEYLHHVWVEDGLEGDTELADALDAAYEDDEALGSLVPDWIPEYELPDGSIVTGELFAYACTGLRSDQMDDVISDLCEQYLNVDQLPINQSLSVDDVLDAMADLRESEGLDPLPMHDGASASSVARIDTFEPHEQLALDEWPDSITQHLHGCAEPYYAASLIRPGDPVEMAELLDSNLEGRATAAGTQGIGAAVKEFDFIASEEVFGDRVIEVNTTLIIVTTC